MNDVSPPPLPKPRRKWLGPALVGTAAVLAAGALLAYRATGLHDLNRSKWRREWKETVIAMIEKQTSDRAWLEKETALVKAKLESLGEDDGGWFSEHLLLLKNGEWIAYASRCRKEDWRIPDLFIGHASDGKWYFTTYHFCRGMLSLRVDDRPESLAKFISIYSLREFDGRSDECLKKTWPMPNP